MTKKYTEGDENLVNYQIWVENGKGKITTPGAATVALQSKKK